MLSNLVVDYLSRRTDLLSCLACKILLAIPGRWPIVQSSSRILHNTMDLVETMTGITLEEDEILVSYDVKSLFTSIPIEETIDMCEKRLNNDETLSDRTTMDIATIISLLRFAFHLLHSDIIISVFSS